MKTSLPTLFLFLFLSASLYCSSQNIDELYTAYTANHPTEKLHIHTDKEIYFPGETIWFKAYLFWGGVPATSATSLYADLLDNNGKVIQHKSMPVLSGSADNFFTLPDTIAGTTFYIRACTARQIADSIPGFFKKLPVAGTAPLHEALSNTEAAILRFYPEGGNLVEGLYNYVAFKATIDNGLPFEISGVVKNNKGEVIDSLLTTNDGMGVLKFTPQPGETYSAEWKDNTGTFRRTPLPETKSSGTLLHTEQVDGELYYMITSTTAEDKLTLLATMNDEVVYTAVMNMQQNRVTQKINTKDFSTGVLQLTVFNSNNQPLADAGVFINNNEYKINASVTILQKGTGKREKNIIEVKVEDTAAADLSVSVYDAELETAPLTESIYSNLLLRNDAANYINNANQYLANSTPGAAVKANLLMQTMALRRYNWNAVVTQAANKSSYAYDNLLSIYGKLSQYKPKAKDTALVNLILIFTDSSKRWFNVPVKSDSSFMLSGLVFYDSATVMYKANSAADNNTSISFAKNYNGLATKLPEFKLPDEYKNVITPAGQSQAGYTQHFATDLKNKNPNFEKSSKLLSELVVKSNGKRSWKDDPIFKMDEKYAVMFAGINSNTFAFDVLHDEMAEAQMDIYNYLANKVPGAVVSTKNWPFKSIQLPSITGLAAPVIYINEFEADNDRLQTIDISSIAYVKVLHSLPGKQGFPPGLLIYLKKGGDEKEGWQKLPSKLSKTKIAGYSATKEFNSPDYSDAKAREANVDLRSTLYWQPYLLLDKTTPSSTIVFYNNDITKRLKVVIEGTDANGRMIHLEKIIE